MLVAQPLVGVFLLVQLGRALGHASAFQTGHHLIHFVSQRVHGALGGLFTRHGLGHVLPPQLGQLGVIRHVGTGGRPCHAGGAAVELDQTTQLGGCVGHGLALDVRFADRCQAHQGLLQRSGLGGHELGIEPGGSRLVGVVVLEEGPAAHVLVAVLHALLPVRAVGAGGHAPLGCAVGVHHGQARLGHVGREGGVPEDLLGDLALRGHRAGFAEGHAHGFLGRVLLHPVHVLGERVDSGWRVGRTATGHAGAHRGALVVSHANAPFIDGQAVGRANVGSTGHRQPRIGETPAQRWVLLAVVHVAVDGLAVDLLDVVGEELGDVFVGGPVQWHAQVVAVLGLELVLDVLALKQVGAEPVQVGKLLVGQLVHLSIRPGGELGADVVLDVDAGVGPLLACAAHVVGQVQDLAVAVVGADQVGVRNPAVVNRLARLHGGLQLLDHVAFLDQVVLDGDARDFSEGLGQGLGFVFVGGDGLGDDRDFLHALGLQLLGGFDEPLHLGHLLVFAQRGWLKLTVDPLLGLCLAGPGGVTQNQGRGGERNRLELHLHCCLLRWNPLG